MVLKFTNFADERGSLIPIEFHCLPFIPRRLFVVKDVPVGVIRGNHAHYLNQQYLICIQGEIEVILHDGKQQTSEILREGEATLIKNLIWDSQKFIAKNSVLLVLCSISYSVEDYIFDFDEFKRIKEIRHD